MGASDPARGKKTANPGGGENEKVSVQAEGTGRPTFARLAAVQTFIDPGRAPMGAHR